LVDFFGSSVVELKVGGCWNWRLKRDGICLRNDEAVENWKTFCEMDG